MKEMNFLRAEANYRLGNLQTAADIINAQGRVDIGGLDPVTVAGTGSLPTCIPRTFDTGACGDLWDALMYEKRIETFGTEPMIPWADARGWGLMTEEGTICQLAPPGRELEVIGMTYYTFGGNAIGSVGRAPAMSGAKCSDQS